MPLVLEQSFREGRGVVWVALNDHRAVFRDGGIGLNKKCGGEDDNRQRRQPECPRTATLAAPAVEENRAVSECIGHRDDCFNPGQ